MQRRLGFSVPCCAKALSVNDGMGDILGIAVNENVLPFFVTCKDLL